MFQLCLHFSETMSVEALQGTFRRPPSLKIKVHEEEACCKQATAGLRSAVAASASIDGLFGVLSYLSNTFQWGTLRREYLCETMQARRRIDCGASQQLALHCLSIYREISQDKDDAQFSLVGAECLVRCSVQDSSYWRHVLELQEQDTENLWAEDGVYYHRCVGLVFGRNELRLWDFGKFHHFLDNSTSIGAIIQLRLTSFDSSIREDAVLMWDGVPCALNKWIDLLQCQSSSRRHSQSKEEAATIRASWYGPTQLRHSESCSPLVPIVSKVCVTRSTMQSEAENDACTNFQISRDETTILSTRNSSLSAFSTLGCGVTSERSSLGKRKQEDGDDELPNSVLSDSDCCDEDDFKAVPVVDMEEDRGWTVLLGGVHMSGNPCSGVGVARALRVAHPSLRLVAIDSTSTNGFSGLVDPVFDECLPIEVMGSSLNHANGSLHEQWNVLLEELLHRRQAIYIPCRERDVDFAAFGKDWIRTQIDCEDIEATSLLHDPADLCDVFERIMCPSRDAIVKVEKPAIALVSTNANLRSLFSVPRFLRLDPLTTSVVEAQAFVEEVGYPVIIKGSRQSGHFCNSWMEFQQSWMNFPWAEGGFAQKVVSGAEGCIAFAAIDGDFTGACLLRKYSHTPEGKVWSGVISPLPSEMLSALVEFVRETSWTGGGELEFVEDFGGRRWLIDFNPRFPAWIFGSHFANCNLPGLLLSHFHYKRIQTKAVASTLASTPFCLTPIATGCRSSVSATPVMSTQIDHSLYCFGAFARTVVEIPVLHHNIVETMVGDYRAGSHSLNCKAMQISIVPQELRGPASILPNSFVDSNADDSQSRDAIPFLQDLNRVCKSMQRFFKCQAAKTPSIEMSVQTPLRILCTANLKTSLLRQKELLERCASMASSDLTVQMCISVKTQPHPAVLQLALKQEFSAECISLAEAQHSEKLGFTPSKIVLTGPGKWWTGQAERIQSTASLDPTACSANGFQRTHCTKKLFRGIYADSLEDLECIVRRVLDPYDWVGAATVGVRWCPFWRNSRFGLDASDVGVVEEAVKMLQGLPESIGIGMHFHYAASTCGRRSWISMISGFLTFCGEFSKLLGRCISVIDLGGGWNPYFLENPAVFDDLKSQLAQLPRQFSHQSGRLPLLQFEPGKSISQSAGAVLSRVLSVRSFPTHTESSSSPDDNDFDELRPTVRRVIVVDASVGEISSPHVHPLYFTKASQWLEALSIDAPESDDVIGERRTNWQPLCGGNDEVWGRSCMEFDRLTSGTIKFPDDVSVGDFVLFCNCGAYDMSMQYDFGDGISRNITTV